MISHKTFYQLNSFLLEKSTTSTEGWSRQLYFDYISAH